MSRSRRKLDTSPIEYDDVVDSPSLKGMVSFLEIPPGELPRLDFSGAMAGAAVPAPEVDPTEEGIPFSGLPVGDVPETGRPDAAAAPSIRKADEPGDPNKGIPLGGPTEKGTPSRGTVVEGVLRPGGPLPGAADSSVPASAAPQPTPPYYYPPVLPRPTVRVRRASLAQDGHSFGEQALYEALWQHAHPYRDDTRIITIGYRRMADLARLTVNNSKANIQSLIQKLAVEEVASFTHSQGRTYLVFSYAAILQRRREAGLTHYIKSRGVAFVDPDTGEPLTERIRDKSGIPFSTPPASPTVPEGEFEGAPQPDVAGIPHSVRPPYSQVISELQRNTTTTAAMSPGGGASAAAGAPLVAGAPSAGPAPSELLDGLRQIAGMVDDEAATLLWHQCRRRAGDCTPAEILHFARAKAAAFRSGRIQNPVGLLLTAVPKCFEGTAFAAYRREQADAARAEARRTREAEEEIARMRREFEAILEDPNSSEEDRRFVRRMLEEN